MDSLIRSASRFAGVVREAMVHMISHAGTPRPPVSVHVEAHDDGGDDHHEEVFTPQPHASNPPSTCTVGVLRGAFQGSVHDLISKHGGTPVELDPSAGTPSELMAKVDALAICGGRDVDPEYYGEKNEGLSGTGPAGSREDGFMIACIQEGYKRGTPMLGMCRGHQLMNVADGGSLYQDFPSQQLAGKSRHGSDGHVVTFDPDSQIAKLIGSTRWSTNTIHHQAVKVAGPNMKITGHTPDGVVEAIERKDNPTQLGTQFHPEAMQDANSHKMFQFLIDSGTKFRAERHAVAAQ